VNFKFPSYAIGLYEVLTGKEARMRRQQEWLRSHSLKDLTNVIDDMVKKDEYSS